MSENKPKKKADAVAVLKEHLPLALIVLTGLGLRFWNIGWGLPSVYEEAYPFYISWKFWNWGSGGFNFNPDFFNYPALTFYFQFLAQVLYYGVGKVTGIFPNLDTFRQAFDVDPTTFIVIARSVSCFFDIGTVVCLYILCLETINKKVAVLAAMFLAINPLHIVISHSVTVDPALTFFVSLSLIFIYEIFKSPRRKWYVFAGIAIGLATASKYNGAVVVFVLIAAHMLKEKSLKEAIRSVVATNVLISVALMVVVFIGLNPFIISNFNKFFLGISFEQYHVSTGHLGINSSQTTISYYLVDVFATYLGVFFLIAVAVSIVGVIISRSKTQIILLLFPLLYLMMLSSWQMRAERYALPLFPFLVVLGCIGIYQLSEHISTMLVKRNIIGRERATIVLLSSITTLALVCAFPVTSFLYGYYHSLSIPDTRTLAKEWLEKNIKTGAIVAFAPLGLEIKDDKYITLPIPFHPVQTELTEPFYDYQLYKNVDVVIGSSFDYARYSLNPEKYRVFLQFYDSLKTKSVLLHEIQPQKNQNGPAIWFYQPRNTENDEGIDSHTINGLTKSELKNATLSFAGKLGLSLSLKKKLQSSTQLLNVALGLDSGNIAVRRTLIQNLYALEEYASAVQEMDSYLRMNPNDPQMLATRGHLYFSAGNYELAEPDLVRSLQLNRRLEQSYLDLSMIYAYADDKARVLEVLKQYLAILPKDGERYAMVEKQIRSIGE